MQLSQILPGQLPRLELAMAMLSVITLCALVIVQFFSASAALIPFQDATFIALNEKTGLLSLFAYNGSKIDERSALHQHLAQDMVTSFSCTPLTPDGLKSVQGWSSLEQYAMKTFGEGNYDLSTNNVDFPAFSCLSNNAVSVTTTGLPTCSPFKLGKSIRVGLLGKITIPYEVSDYSASAFMISRPSTLSGGSTSTKSFHIPNIAGGDDSANITAQFTNTVGSSFFPSIANEIPRSIDLRAPTGQVCSLTFTSSNCHQNTQGNIEYLASGWVWFNYHRLTNGHRKWAVKIEKILPSTRDRNSIATFYGSTINTSTYDYRTSCG